MRCLIEGAEFLLTNDYEKTLLESKTGLSDAEVLERVKVQVTTLGKNGVEITGRDMEQVQVPVAREIQAYDPTGVGDGFRAGFFAGALLGAVAGALGPGGRAARDAGAGDRRHAGVRGQGDEFAKRLAESYGDDAAADVLPLLTR